MTQPPSFRLPFCEMPQPLQGKIARQSGTSSPFCGALTQITVVTGSSRGIGAAIAKRLAQDGAFVVMNYASSEEAAKEVVDDQLYRWW